MSGAIAKLEDAGGGADAPGRNGRGPGLGGDAGALQALWRQFAAFRAKGERGRKVPEALRAAVVDALRQGFRPEEVRRACGLSWSQLQWWGGLKAGRPRRVGGRRRGGRGSSKGARGRAASRLRVFPVVDDVQAARATAAAAASAAAGAEPKSESPVLGDETLELRLGPWAVSVRLAARPSRGRPCCH